MLPDNVVLASGSGIGSKMFHSPPVTLEPAATIERPAERPSSCYDGELNGTETSTDLRQRAHPGHPALRGPRGDVAASGGHRVTRRYPSVHLQQRGHPDHRSRGRSLFLRRRQLRAAQRFAGAGQPAVRVSKRPDAAVSVPERPDDRLVTLATPSRR